MTLPSHPNYKISEVDWLGAIPAHWSIGQSRRLFYERKERARSGDTQLTASQKYGVISQRRFMEMEGQRVVQVLTGQDILKHVEQGDFVISMRSFQGGIEVAQEGGCISSAYVPLAAASELDRGYFTYLFKCAPYIQALQSTSNLVRDGQALRFENFAMVSLPLVPRQEQTAIAAFLDRETGKIDTLMEEQKRLIELLKEKRQAVISHAVTKGPNRDAPMKDSGVEWLGMVPKHWDVGKLGRFLSMQEGPGLRTWQFTDEGIRVICVTNITEGGIDFSRLEKFISFEEYKELYQRFTVSQGDVLLSSSGNSWGKVATYFGDEKVILNTSTIRINESSDRRIVRAYIEWILQSVSTREQLELAMTGACQPNFGPSHLSKISVTLPPPIEQEKICAFLTRETEKLSNLAFEAEKQIHLLSERRSALIAAAVTGKIDVRHVAEAQVAAE